MADSAWPADTVERWPLERLIGYARNAKTHPPEQVARIAASIREFGWTIPVLVDEAGTLIAGHGRVLAARQLGLSDIPTMVARGWTDAQVKAYRLADNKLTESAWDNDLLALELKELADAGVDLALTGFDPQELTSLLLDRTAVGNTDPDDAPGIPVNPITELGDAWELGSLGHRVVCGDCTDPVVVAACLGGVKPNLMVTDPPYGVEYDANWRNNVVRKKGTRVGDKLAGRAVGKVLNDDRSDWRTAWALFPGNVCYVWHAGIKAASVEESLRATGFKVRSQIVWVKTRFVISRAHYHQQHEPAYYATREGDDGWQRFEDDHALVAYAARDGKAAEWKGGRKQSTVWFVDHVKSETGHSTQKPVECMRRPIENNSSVGQAVYEPFLGSGTTLIAGEMTGRTVLAVELNPAYVDVAVSRWCKFTGQKARRSRDGFEWDGVMDGG